MTATRRLAVGALIVTGFGLLAWSRLRHGGRINPDLQDAPVLVTALLACAGAERLLKGTWARGVLGWTAGILVSGGLGYWAGRMMGSPHVLVFWLIAAIVFALGIVTFRALQAIATSRD